MDKPTIVDAPGLAWRARKNGWAAVWLARQDIAKAGFKPSTCQIAVFEQQPDEDQAQRVRATCVRLQEEMYTFGTAKPKVFDGTVRALIHAYQSDPDSRFHGMRYRGRLRIAALVKRVDDLFGTAKLADLGARDFNNWYAAIRWPDGKDGRDITTTAHAAMTAVRMVFKFGAVYEISPQCARLKAILSGLVFENGKSRSEAMTLKQCKDLIAAAHSMGFPSIALAQAIQFDLCLRQKDVIGEWVPVSEPGMSAITRHGYKWLSGLRWEEITADMLVSHKMSKSRTGKVLEFDLKVYPMVMHELARIPVEQRFGPVVVNEATGRPWKQNNFRIRWRQAATAAGIPVNIWNMDSRAGGTTETIEATGGNIEAARKQAGHSNSKTTQRYSRGDLKSNNDTAVLRYRGRNEG